MGRIFISCGQSTVEERGLGSAIAAQISELTPFEPYFAEQQTTLAGLTEKILLALNDAAGLIAVFHRRGEVSVGGRQFTRTSVWVEQEIAIAAFIHQVLQRPLQIAIYQEAGTTLEGIRGQLLLNAISFERDEDVVGHLRLLLPTWASTIRPNVELQLDIQSSPLGAGARAHPVRGTSTDRQEYLLVITGTNRTKRVLAPTHAEIEIPGDVVDVESVKEHHQPERDTGTHRVFRVRDIQPLYQGDSRRIFQAPYHLDWDFYKRRNTLFEQWVRARVYMPDERILDIERRLRELQVFWTG